MVAAPTGLAAHNIGGTTIHRLLSLPIEHGKPPRIAENHTIEFKKSAVSNNLRNEHGVLTNTALHTHAADRNNVQ